MTIRKSTVLAIFFFTGVLALGAILLVHPRLAGEEYDTNLAQRKRLVRELDLTDLCLFTEARYTRHLSQADLHSAFQDHPMALEHFPSGSLVTPPQHLLKR